jgi:hypothetical protein
MVSAHDANLRELRQGDGDEGYELGRIPGFAETWAFRLYLLPSATSKGYRFNPLRGERLAKSKLS